MAVDGLDLRNIDLSLTLTPKTSNVKIKEYIGKTVLTGIGFGATWGSRRLRFKASNVIATIDIPWQRLTCDSKMLLLLVGQKKPQACSNTEGSGD